MKPFSTPVLSKRTYRELKLLKHIQHENVRIRHTVQYPHLLIYHLLLDYQPERCVHISAGGFVSPLLTSLRSFMLTVINRYFVTELLGTDLHRLLTSRPLEKQFVQYFLYQILVSAVVLIHPCLPLISSSVD